MYKLHVPGKETVGEGELTCLRLAVWDGSPTGTGVSKYLGCYGCPPNSISLLPMEMERWLPVLIGGK